MQRKNNSRCMHSLERLTRTGVEFIIWREVITFVGIIYFTILRSMIVIFCIRGTSGGTFTTIMNFSLNSVFSKWGHVLTFTMAYLWGCNLFRKEHHYQKGLNSAICLPVPCLKCWWSKMIFSLCIILLQTFWKQMPWNFQQIFIYWSKIQFPWIVMSWITKVATGFVYIALLDLCM